MESRLSFTRRPTGSVIRDNQQYVLTDNTFLSNLVLSHTELKVGQATNGHKHDNEEEVYFFTSGEGEITIDAMTYKIVPGDVVQIRAGEFHKVSNIDGVKPLRFFAVFQKYAGRGK